MALCAAPADSNASARAWTSAVDLRSGFTQLDLQQRDLVLGRLQRPAGFFVRPKIGLESKDQVGQALHQFPIHHDDVLARLVSEQGVWVIRAQPLADPRRVPPELDRSFPGGHESNIHAPMLGTNGGVARQRHEARVRRSSRSEPDQSSGGPHSRRHRRSTANSLSRQSPQHVCIVSSERPDRDGGGRLAGSGARSEVAPVPRHAGTPTAESRAIPLQFPLPAIVAGHEATRGPLVSRRVPPAEGRNSSFRVVQERRTAAGILHTSWSGTVLVRPASTKAPGKRKPHEPGSAKNLGTCGFTRR